MLKLSLSNITLPYLAVAVFILLTFNNNCNASVNATDNATMVWVPGGTFTMGNDWFEFPKHQVTLSGYWIYKYEVTVAQYRAFCTATGRALPTFPSGYSWNGKASWTNATLQQHPIVNVDWDDAKAYADWAQVKLPTEAQWEYAACGQQKNNYPWGGIAVIDDYYNGFDKTKCANYLNSANKNISTWVVGSFPTGASWCGALDMAGNAWEWCSDWSENYSEIASTDPTGPETGDTKVIRGGGWSGDAEYSTRGTNRLNYAPANATPFFGFRCVSNAPGPLTAVAIAISPDTAVSVGKTVTLTATTTGGTTLQYKFMKGAEILRDFATENSISWTSAVTETTDFTVIAKDFDNTTVTSSVLNVTVHPALTTTTLITAPVNNVVLGLPVTLTASATGGVDVQYKFMNGNTVLRDFNANNLYEWTPDTTGNDSLKVIASDVNYTVESSVVNFVVYQELTAVSLTPTVTVMDTGQLVTLTATATGGLDVKYKFMHGITVLRDFSADNTFTWTPQDAVDAGLTVIASDANNTVTSAVVNIAVHLALSAVTLTPSIIVMDTGQSVTLTATATGGTDVKYKFMHGTTVLRDFAADNTFIWTPQDAGDAGLTVIASDANNTVTSAVVNIAVHLALSAVTLTPTITVMDTGQSVTLTATATGGTDVKYKFMHGTTVLRDFSADNTFIWTPQNAGDAGLTVIASDANNTVTSAVVNITVHLALSAVTLTPTVTVMDTGQSVTLTATATGGTDVKYKFMHGTTVLRDFSADNTFIWTPQDAGDAGLTVIASDANNTVTSTVVNIAVHLALSAVTLTPTVTVMDTGQSVTMTATATGGTDVKYKFMHGTTVLRDFSADNTFTWTPQDAGIAGITVIASDANTTVSSTVVNITVQLALSAVTLTPSVTVMDTGQSVTLTATATGGTDVKYKFMHGTTVLRDFSADNTFIWTPQDAGDAGLTVIASDANNTVTSAVVNIAVHLDTSLKSVVLTTLPAITAISGVPVTLTATATGGKLVQYKFMSGTTVIRDFAANNTLIWTPAYIKLYSLVVIARDIQGTNPDLAMTSPVVNLNVKSALSAVAVSTVTIAPYFINNPIILSCTAIGGASVQYQFMDGDVVIRDFADSNSYTWIPVSSGIHNVKVVARDIAVNPNITVTSINKSFSVNNYLSGVSLTSSPLNAAVSGMPVTLTAIATDGALVQYKFMYGNVMLRDFSAVNSFTWTPAVLTTYTVSVIARDIKGIDPNATVSSQPIDITIKPALTAVSLTPSVLSPIFVGQQITLTAKATNGAAVQYKFISGDTVIRDFSGIDNILWTPTTGIHTLTVIARDVNSHDPNATVTSATLNYQVCANLTAVNLSTAPANTAVIGMPVILTATPVGGMSVQYKFMYGTLVLRDFASSNSLTYKFLNTKIYNLTVVARDVKGTDSNFTVTSAIVPISIRPALTRVSLTTSVAGPIVAGQPLTLTANVNDGAAVMYKFMNGDTIIRDFTADKVFVWTPPAGTQTITVVARDANSSDPNATVVSVAKNIVVVPVLSAVSMTTTPAGFVVIGKPVTLIAAATGGLTVQYKFMFGSVVLRDFAAGNSFNWTPGFVKSYSLTVIARDTSGLDPTTTVISPVTTIIVTAK